MNEEFESYLNRNLLNKKTIQSYIKNIFYFLQFLEEQKIQIHNTTEEEIRKYLLKLKEKGYSSSTIAKKTTALRVFFKFLRQEKNMQLNPLDNIHQPKIVPKIKKNNEFLKEKIFRDGDEREKLIYCLLNKEKISAKEIVSLKKENYNKELNILYLKTHACTPDEETAFLLKKMIEKSQKYIIETKKEKQMSGSAIYYLIHKYN